MIQDKPILCLITLATLFFVFLQVLINNGMNNKETKISKEFPVIEKDSSISGIVLFAREPFNGIPQGSLLITLEDGSKFSAINNALPLEIEVNRNNITSLFLYNFLERGDSIYKPAHKDSLYVFRKEEKYTFRYWLNINFLNLDSSQSLFLQEVDMD